MYELDGNKLYCSAPDKNSPNGLCGGEIDYDDGFNFLRCSKCGVQYRVKELSKAIKEETVMIKGNRRKSKMKVAVKRNGTLISNAEEAVLKEAVPKISKEEVFDGKPVGTLKVSIKRTEKEVHNNSRYNKRDNRKNNQNNNYNKKNNNEGNNRGVVRYAGTNNKKEELSTAYGTMMSDIKTEKVKTYTAEQLSGMEFLFSSYDAENNLLILKTEDNVRVCLDLNTLDKETYDILFEHSDYMLELEQAKNDLFSNEQLLDTKKSEIDSLKKSLAENENNIKKIIELKAKVSDLENELIEKNMKLQEEDKELGVDAEDEITSLKSEIERLKRELESEKHRSLEDYISRQEYDKKSKEVEDLSRTIDDMAETINKLTIESSENNGKQNEIDKLRKELASKNEKLSNQKQDYEAKLASLEELLQKANQTIDDMSSDYDADDSDEDFEEVDFDQYSNFSCIHGIVTTFNEILDATKEEGTEVTEYDEDNNHSVIAFPDGEGGFLGDVDHNIIVTASVNNMNVDDIVVLSRNRYNKIMKKIDALEFNATMKETPVGVTQQ